MTNNGITIIKHVASIVRKDIRFNKKKEINGWKNNILDDLNDPNNQKEYTIRPTYNDKCWKDLLHFRI